MQFRVPKRLRKPKRELYIIEDIDTDTYQIRDLNTNELYAQFAPPYKDIPFTPIIASESEVLIGRQGQLVLYNFRNQKSKSIPWSNEMQIFSSSEVIYRFEGYHYIWNFRGEDGGKGDKIQRIVETHIIDFVKHPLHERKIIYSKLNLENQLIFYSFDADTGKTETITAKFEMLNQWPIYTKDQIILMGSKRIFQILTFANLYELQEKRIELIEDIPHGKCYKFAENKYLIAFAHSSNFKMGVLKVIDNGKIYSVDNPELETIARFPKNLDGAGDRIILEYMDSNCILIPQINDVYIVDIRDLMLKGDKYHFNKIIVKKDMKPRRFAILREKENEEYNDLLVYIWKITWLNN